MADCKITIEISELDLESMAQAASKDATLKFNYLQITQNKNMRLWISNFQYY